LYENGPGVNIQTGVIIMSQTDKVQSKITSSLTIGQQWAAYAVPLARLVMARYVNRTDAYGGFNPLNKRGREYTRKDGTTATYGKNTTHKRRLTLRTVIDHFQAGVMGAGIFKPEDWLNLAPARVIGPHTASANDTSRTTTVEVDAHDGPVANEAGIIAGYDCLRTLGFRPLLWTSDERGGFHLDTLYHEAPHTNISFAFGEWLKTKWRSWGLPAEPESLPKQPRVKGVMPYGSWCRLIGRHHTRDVWAKVWNGVGWLEGDAAARYVIELLSRGGDDYTLIPPEVLAIAAEELKQYQATHAAAGQQQQLGCTLPVSTPVRPWVDPSDHASAADVLTPGRRYAYLFKIATGMRGMGGDYDAILGRLKAVNAQRCRPEKTESDLVALAKDVVGRYTAGVPIPTEDIVVVRTGRRQGDPLPAGHPAAGWHAARQFATREAAAVRGGTTAAAVIVSLALASPESVAAFITEAKRQEERHAESLAGLREQLAPVFERAAAERKTEREIAALRHQEGDTRCRCPRPHTKVMRRLDGTRLMLLKVGCNTACCAECQRRLKEEWKIVIRGHVAACSDADGAFVLFDVPGTWDKNFITIRAFAGRFLHVKQLDLTRRPSNLVGAFVLNTANPAAITAPGGTPVRIVPRKQFLAEVEAAIDAAPNGKVVGTGRGWGKPKRNREGAAQFEAAGGLTDDWEDNVQLLEEETGLRVDREAIPPQDRDRVLARFRLDMPGFWRYRRRQQYALFLLNHGIGVDYDEWLMYFDHDEEEIAAFAGSG
jgi:hypothetical protein